MWYNRLNEYLIKKGDVNNLICPSIVIKKTTSGFVIIAIYIDDLNVIGTHKEILEAMKYLKGEFEMKGHEQSKFFPWFID